MAAPPPRPLPAARRRYCSGGSPYSSSVGGAGGGAPLAPQEADAASMRSELDGMFLSAEAMEWLAVDVLLAIPAPLIRR